MTETERITNAVYEHYMPVEAHHLGVLAARCEVEAEHDGLTESERYVLRHVASQYRMQQEEILMRQEAMERGAQQLQIMQQPMQLEEGNALVGATYGLLIMGPLLLIFAALVMSYITKLTAFTLTSLAIASVVALAYLHPVRRESK